MILQKWFLTLKISDVINLIENDFHYQLSQNPALSQHHLIELYILNDYFFKVSPENDVHFLTKVRIRDVGANTNFQMKEGRLAS